MYKGLQDKSDFLGRVASHATKGSKRGIVWDIPLSAVQALEQECEAREWKLNQYLSALPDLRRHYYAKSAHFAHMKQAAVANLRCYETRKAAGRKVNVHQLKRAYDMLTACLRQYSQLERLIGEINSSGRDIPCRAVAVQPANAVSGPGLNPVSPVRAAIPCQTVPMKGGASHSNTGSHGYGQ